MANSCEELPEKPYFQYASGVIDYDGRTAFLEGRVDENCSYWSAPLVQTKRERLMLVELPERMNPQQICEFLDEEKFERLGEKAQRHRWYSQGGDSSE
jgi:hypothetical protein